MGERGVVNILVRPCRDLDDVDEHVRRRGVACPLLAAARTSWLDGLGS